MTKKTEESENFNPYSRKNISAAIIVLSIMFGGNAGLSIFQNENQCNMIETQNQKVIAENKQQISKIKDDVSEIKYEQIKLSVTQEAIHTTIKRVEAKLDNP